MTIIAKKLAIVSLAMGMGVTAVSLAQAADPEKTIHLQAQATRVVENDEMQAVLYAEFTEKDPAVLANKLNTINNQAVKTAKSYNHVKLRSGTQTTYPLYDDQQRSKGWRGKTQIILTSQDFQQMAKLIGSLQSSMRLNSVDFTLSDAQRYQLETELHVEASNAFKQRAKALSESWDARQYKLLNLSFSNGTYSPRPQMRTAMSMSMAKVADVAAPQLESGESTISITAEGSIQLQ